MDLYANNTEKRIQKREYFIILTACLLYFFVAKNISPAVVYSLIVLLFAFYFLPVRLINFKYEKTRQDKIAFVFSSVIISKILTLSIILTYIDDSGFYNSVFLILLLLNFVMLVFSYLKASRKYVCLHLLLLVFTAVVQAL